MNHPPRLRSGARLVGPLACCPALICILPLTLAAADYSATATGSGQWQDLSRWSITPAGSPSGFPNNEGGDLYDVTVPASFSFDLNADVSVRNFSVTSGAGVTFQNASSRTLRVDGLMTLPAGTSLNTQSAVTLVTAGEMVTFGTILLNNGARLENLGLIVVSSDQSGASHEADDSPRDGNWVFRNSGTVVFNEPGAAVTLRNYVTQNAGEVDITAGTMDHTSSYTQVDGGITRVRSGGQLKSNQLRFSGGTVFAGGDGLNGSNFQFDGGTLEIGVFANAAADLRLAGNVTGPHTGGVFEFDLGGLTPGVLFDQLDIPNGMNFGEITLNVGLIDGFVPADTDVFRIITGNNFNGTFLNEVNGKLDVAGVGEFTVTHQGQFVELGGFVPVPEPGPAVLLAAGLLARLGWRRRA